MSVKEKLVGAGESRVGDATPDARAGQAAGPQGQGARAGEPAGSRHRLDRRRLRRRPARPGHARRGREARPGLRRGRRPRQADRPGGARARQGGRAGGGPGRPGDRQGERPAPRRGAQVQRAGARPGDDHARRLARPGPVADLAAGPHARGRCVRSRVSPRRRRAASARPASCGSSRRAGRSRRRAPARRTRARAAPVSPATSSVVPLGQDVGDHQRAAGRGRRARGPRSSASSSSSRRSSERLADRLDLRDADRPPAADLVLLGVARRRSPRPARCETSDVVSNISRPNAAASSASTRSRYSTAAWSRSVVVGELRITVSERIAAEQHRRGRRARLHAVLAEALDRRASPSSRRGRTSPAPARASRSSRCGGGRGSRRSRPARRRRRSGPARRGRRAARGAAGGFTRSERVTRPIGPPVAVDGDGRAVVDVLDHLGDVVDQVVRRGRSAARGPSARGTAPTA